MHDHMIRTQGTRSERTPELVQLTDQSFHHLFLLVAALLITLL
jgi:hypothetical protein